MRPSLFSGDGMRRLRLSRTEKLENLPPSLSRRSQFHERRKPSALWALEHQKVHARRVHGILGPLQKPGINEHINRFGDLLHVVSHKGGELFVRQERARMPMQKHQQIEFTSGPYERNTSEQPLGLFQVWTVCGRVVAHDGMSAHPQLASVSASPQPVCGAGLL